MHIEKSQIIKVKTYVKRIASDLDELHNINHFETVAENAKVIARTENYDEDTAYVAGWLHDIGRVKYKGKWVEETEFFNHGILGAQIAEEFLNQINFDKEEIKVICEAIRFHVKPKTQKTKLAKILWDAYKLWAFNQNSSELWLKYFLKRGMTEKQARERIKFDRSYYYPLFYTKISVKMADDFLESAGEEIYHNAEIRWEPPNCFIQSKLR